MQEETLPRAQITKTAAFTETLMLDQGRLDRLKRFLQDYDTTLSYALAQQTITAFIEDMTTACLTSQLYTELTRDDLCECWEKLVLTKLNQSLFALPTSHDARLDKIIEFKIQKNSWLLERHLDLPFFITTDILAIFKAEIYKINSYRAPKDKLTVIHNAIQILANCIHALTDVTASNDYLLAGLVLMLVRCKIPLVMSNIKYIKRFRNQAKLQEGSTAYHLTTLVSALSFICNCKIADFTMDDMERSMRAASVARFVESKKGNQPLDRQDSFVGYASSALIKTGTFFGELFNDARLLITPHQTNETSADRYSPTNQDATPVSGLSRVHSRIASLVRARTDQETVDVNGSSSAGSDERTNEEERFQQELSFALSLSIKDQEHIEQATLQGLSDTMLVVLEPSGAGRETHIDLESPIVEHISLDQDSIKKDVE